MHRGVIVAAIATVATLSLSGCSSSADNCKGPAITLSPTGLHEGDTVQVTVTGAWETCDWRGHGDKPHEGPILITAMNSEANSIVTDVGVLIDANGAGSATLDTSHLAPGTYPVFTGLPGIEQLDASDSPIAQLTVAAG